MKNFSRRLAALLVVLAMTVTALGAVAEMPKVPSPADVYARGNTLKTEVDVQIDNETVAGLFGMFMGGQSDPSMMTMVTQITNAITKLKTTILADLQSASIAVGTDAGTLLNVQAKADESGALAAFDLLPGIQLSVPQEMVKAMLDSQASFQAPDIAKESMVPYVNALNAYLNEKVLGPAKSEEGSFDIEGIAAFNTRYDFDVTNGLVAGLLSSVTEVFRTDTQMQGLLDEYLAGLNTASQVGGEEGVVQGSLSTSTTVKNSAELLAELDQMIAEANEQPDELIANSRAYINKENGAYYVELESPQGTKEPVLVSLASVGTMPATDVKIELIVNSAQPDYGMAPETTPEVSPEPQPVDWSAVRQGILIGNNPAATMVNLFITSAPDAAGANMESKVEAIARVQGMVIALAVDGKAALQGDFAAEGTFKLTALTDSPLLTVVYKLSEVTEKPAPLVDAEKVIQMSEDALPPESEEALNASLEQGLPLLMERLQTVLPEEGATLIMLIQQAMTPPAPIEEAPAEGAEAPAEVTEAPPAP